MALVVRYDTASIVGWFKAAHLPTDFIYSAVSYCGDDILTEVIGPGVDSVFNVVQHSFQNIRVYKTDVHTKIFSFLADMAFRLCMNEFQGKVGLSCATLVGAKGVGKSFCIQAFAVVAPTLMPRLLTLYVNIEYVRVPLNRVIRARMLQHGLEVPPADDNSDNICLLIVETLVRHDVRLLIMVDEMQILYTRDGERYPAALQTIQDLAFLGGQNSGFVSVILSGSATNLAGLISMTVNRHDPIYEGYALLRTGAFGLNSTKFSSVRVPAVLPNNISAVAQITDKNMDVVEDLQWLRVTAFYCGCNVRQVEKMLQSRKLENQPLEVNSPGVPPEGQLVRLRETIYDVMLKKNARLCQALFRGTELEVLLNVQLTPWPEAWRPITDRDLHKPIQKMVNSKEGFELNRLEDLMLYLADHSSIILYGTVGSDRQVYPPNMLSMLQHARGQSFLPGFEVRARDAIAAAPAVVLGQPRALAVVAALVMGGGGCSVS